MEFLNHFSDKYQISGSQAMARRILVLEGTLIPFLSTII